MLSMTSLRQHILEYFYFQCKIQFELPVQQAGREAAGLQPAWLGGGAADVLRGEEGVGRPGRLLSRAARVVTDGRQKLRLSVALIDHDQYLVCDSVVVNKILFRFWYFGFLQFRCFCHL